MCIYTYTYMYLQLSSFWFCLNLPPQLWVQSQFLSSVHNVQVQQHQLWELAWCRCLSLLCDHGRVSGQVSRVTAGHSSLNFTKPVRATDTSRFLHQTPWLPLVELVVGCLEHLFYVTYQLKNTARHLSSNWAKAGEVHASDPDLAHTAECRSQARLYYPNEQPASPLWRYFQTRSV